MNRRSFVGLLGIAGAVAAIAPKVLAPSGNEVLARWDSNGNLTVGRGTVHLDCAGSRMVAFTGRSTTALAGRVTPGDWWFNVEDNHLTKGDRVFIQDSGAIEFMEIASDAYGNGPYLYDVIRNLDGSGAKAWGNGTTIWNTGQRNSAFI